MFLFLIIINCKKNVTKEQLLEYDQSRSMRVLPGAAQLNFLGAQNGTVSTFKAQIHKNGGLRSASNSNP